MAKLLLFFIMIELALSNNIESETINYRNYLQVTSFDNLQKHEKYRENLNSIEEKNIFLYELTDYFLKTHPSSMENIEERISMGEKYLLFNSGKGEENDMAYRIVGYFFLGKMTKIIEKEFKETSSVLGPSKRLIKLKKRLEKLKIYLKIRENDTRKLLKYIRNGNFEYIFYRFCLKFCPNSTKDNNKDISINPLLENNNEVFQILREEEKIGELVWLKQKRYKIHYLVDENVSVRYKQFIKKNKLNIKAVMTGAFTNINNQIEGLTIENGSIKNAVLLPHRDGLVFLYDNGKTKVINLQNKKFLLPNTNILVNPIEKVKDYGKVIEWSKEHNGTIFQTQLLGYNDQSLMHLASSKSKIKERRLWVIIHDEKGEESHLIINMPSAIDLANLTQKVLDFLKSKKYTVNAILNLDVGGYDIFAVYCKNKKILTSPVAIEEATNLIFYSEIETPR